MVERSKRNICWKPLCRDQRIMYCKLLYRDQMYSIWRSFKEDLSFLWNWSSYIINKEGNSYPPPLQDIIDMSDLRYSGAVLIWWWRVMILCLQCYAHWYTTCMILTKAHQRLSDMLASTMSYWFRNIIPLHSMCINRLETMFLHCRFERRDLPHAFPWKLFVCDGICTWVQDLVEPLRYALTLSLCNFLGGSCEHRFKQHMNEYNV